MVEFLPRLVRALRLLGAPLGELAMVSTVERVVKTFRERLGGLVLCWNPWILPPQTTRPSWIASWNDLLSGAGIHLGLAAFEGGRTLEPDESVEDRAFLGLPDSGYGAIRVTATVAPRTAGKSWFNDEVVIVDPRVANDFSGEAESGTAQAEGGAP